MTHSQTEYDKQASTSHRVSQKNMLSKLQQGENKYDTFSDRIWQVSFNKS